MPEESPFNIIVQQGEIRIDHHLLPLDSFDNTVLETSGFYFVLEGLVINKRKLTRQYATSDFKLLLQHLILEVGIGILKIIEGEIRGILWQKRENKVYAFTNHTATQRMFYYHQNDFFAASNSLVHLVNVLRSEKQPVTPNIEAMFQLLALGVMLEDSTPIKNVLKILDGNYVVYDYHENSLTTEMYYSAFGQNTMTQSKAKILDTFEECFSDAVGMEYDSEDHLKAVTFLSGGLDSRVALMKAKERFKIQEAFCFSHSGYWDHKISKEIATDLKVPYRFQALDGGDFLRNIDRLTRISEGTTLFLGGIHVDFALRSNYKPTEIIMHSGQIGDGILGGFNSGPQKIKPQLSKFSVKSEILSRIQSQIEDIMSSYPDEESFYLRNLAYGRTVLGAQVCNQFGRQTSPFMSKDFLSFAGSVPPRQKYLHRMYLDWVHAYCPTAQKYRWETTLLKPKGSRSVWWNNKVFARWRHLKYGVLVQQPYKLSMAPYPYYYDNSKNLQNIYSEYYNQNLFRVKGCPELETIVSQLFTKQSFYDKALAINVLSIFKLYFSE